MTALAPCPFCGGDDVQIGCTAYVENYYVWCADCDAQGPSGTNSERRATRLWNKRVDATEESTGYDSPHYTVAKEVVASWIENDVAIHQKLLNILTNEKRGTDILAMLVDRIAEKRRDS